MDEVLKAILAQLTKLESSVTALAARLDSAMEKLDRHNADLEEFSERFDDVMTRIENERRLDYYSE